MGRRTAEERRRSRAQLKQKNEALRFRAPRSTLPDALAGTVADMSKLLRPLAETLGQAALAKVVLRLDSAIYRVLCETADECPKLLHLSAARQLRQKHERLTSESRLHAASKACSTEHDNNAAPAARQRPQKPRVVSEQARPAPAQQPARTSKPASAPSLIAPPVAPPRPVAPASAPHAEPAQPQQPGPGSSWEYGDLFASLKVDRERG